MTPAGHLLGDPHRRTGDWTYRARCACGLDVYGPTLPRLWAAHDMHLSVVQAMSQGRHPSQRREETS